MDNISTKKKVGMNLTEGPILPLMLKFMLPMLIASFIQQLYNAVDMIVIGQYVGPTGTVGVAQGGEAANMVTFIATALASASQIYVAQLFGAKKTKEISETITTAIVFTLCVSLFFAVICIVFCKPFLALINCPEEALDQASDYMIIVSLGLPFVMGYNTICGLLRGLGESKRPMIFIAISATANIFMDLLLVAVFRLEAAGTAIATIIAQMASCIAAFIYLYKKRTEFGIEFNKSSIRMNREHLRVLTRLGIPLMLSQAVIHVSMLVSHALINRFGLVASATNSIGNKVQALINIIANSISQSTSAMIAQNLGARKHSRVRQIMKVCILTALVFAIIPVTISLTMPRAAFRIFTKDAEVIELGVVFLHTCIIGFLCTPFLGVMNALTTGSGNVRLNFVALTLDSLVFRIGLSLLLAYTFNLGIVGFFLGTMIARWVPVLIQSVYFFSGKWTKTSLIKD